MRVAHMIKTEGLTAGLTTYVLHKSDKLHLYISKINLTQKAVVHSFSRSANMSGGDLNLITFLLSLLV